jgi:hypothetical protein
MLVQLGLTGERAGQQIAAGANHAAVALRGTERAATDAGAAVAANLGASAPDCERVRPACLGFSDHSWIVR